MYISSNTYMAFLMFEDCKLRGIDIYADNILPAKMT